jgi:hypothetical protein
VSTVRRRAVVAAHLLSESVWVYALGAVLGTMAGYGRGPLNWWSVVVLLGGSYLVVRFLQLVRMPTFVAQYAMAVLAALAVYLAIGAQLGSGLIGIDVLWPRNLGASPQPEGFQFIVAIGGFLAAGLWWRGGRVASIDQPVESLEFSFRLGLLALAVAAVIDMAAPDDLRVFPLMFVFFAAALGGLSVGHLRPSSKRAAEEKAWFRTIGVVVGAVLAAGVVFAIVERFILSWLSGPASWLLGMVGWAVFYVLVLPFAYLFGLVAQGIVIVLNWLVGERQFEAQDTGEIGQALREQQQMEAAETPGYLAYIEWTVVAVLVLVVLFFVARAFRRRMVRLEEEDEGLRESISEEADPAADLAHLLYSLLPDRFTRKAGKPVLRVPEGDADVAEVFRIYFGFLALAEKSGFARPSWQTPKEYQHTLERVFPRDIVHRVTVAFDRACYGHRAPPQEQIDELRLSLEQLAQGAG